MRNFLMFIGNFLLSLIFSFDILDYYFIGGINIINDDVNRVFIMWFGLIISLSSSVYFVSKKLTK